MFPYAGYDSQIVHLDPGDRLILYSDGVTECQNPHGELFGDEQMHALMGAAARAPSAGLTATLSDSLRSWRGRSEYEDDISVLVLERPLESNGEPNPESLPGESR